MVIQGSSSLRNISGVGYITGPSGSIGPTGARGLTGTTGQRGPIGFTGYGITGSVSISTIAGTETVDRELVFGLVGYVGPTGGVLSSLGATLGVTGVQGSTGNINTTNYTITNILSGSNYAEIFKSIEGNNATFRDLTVSGNDISFVQLEHADGTPKDSDTILIRGITHDTGNLGNTGELIFINDSLEGLSANAAVNTFWSGDQLTARILTHKERFFITGSGGETSNNWTEWGVTAGHTGQIDYETVDGYSTSFSSITDRENTGVAGVTAMVSGIITGDSGGVRGTWGDIGFYQFGGATGIIFNSSFAPEPDNIGSCCYCRGGTVGPGDPGQDHRGCVDYVSKEYCDGVGGWFSFEACLGRSEGINCHYEGMCCVNGKCIETTDHKCGLFGGFFIPINQDADLIDCGDLSAYGSAYGAESNGCPSPCGLNGACCINGECLNVTEYECSLSLNSTWQGGDGDELIQCDDGVNCCMQELGACCVDEKCYHTTADVCITLWSNMGQPPAEQGGIFWGAGSRCAGLQLDPNVSTVIDQTYAPYNCLVHCSHLQCGSTDCCNESPGYVVTGVLGENDLCSDNTPPPCAGCEGWQQRMGTPDDCSYNQGPFSSTYCLCDDSTCHCPGYECLDPNSCGTIKLQDDSCWECCKSAPQDVEQIKAACCHPAHDGVGSYICSMETYEDCVDQAGGWGIWSQGMSCSEVDCNWGACCHTWGCEPAVSVNDCIGAGGVWIANGNCNNDPCSEYRVLGGMVDFAGESHERSQEGVELYLETMALRNPRVTKQRVIGNSARDLKHYSIPESRKLVDPPDAKQFKGPFIVSQCIEPGVVIPPVDELDQWIIEVGSGDCSCCCPGVCWEGALGDGGIVTSCKDISNECYNTFDPSGGCVGSSGLNHDIVSLPTDNKPICVNDTWESNKYGCKPYIDDDNPDNPIWMVCSCCCKKGGPVEFTEPVPCSECETRPGECVCVNGCGNCFS